MDISIKANVGHVAAYTQTQTASNAASKKEQATSWFDHIEGWRMGESQRYLDEKATEWVTDLMENKPAHFRSRTNVGYSLQSAAATTFHYFCAVLCAGRIIVYLKNIRVMSQL